MGNYSYLIYTLNCKNTIIDIKKVLDFISNKDNYQHDDWDYASIDENDIKEFKIVSLEDYAKSKHDRKFIQYLTPNSIKTLQIISKYTTSTNEIDKNPKIFYEYEGWDELYYIEFVLGTEKIYLGYYAFDFDEQNDEYKNSIKEIYTEERFKKLSFSEKQADSEWGNTTDYEEYIDGIIFKKKNEYIYNLCKDKNTKWEFSELIYNPIKKKDSKSLSLELLMMLSGIRRADMLNNIKNNEKKFS